MKDRQQSSSSNWILLSPNLQILLFLLQEGKAGIALASTTLELLLNYWKCFGFLKTYFPAFISSDFPVCFRTFGRELLSSWLPLSDDDTQGLGKKQMQMMLSLWTENKKKISVFVFLNYKITVFLLKLQTFFVRFNIKPRTNIFF